MKKLLLVALVGILTQPSSIIFSMEQMEQSDVQNECPIHPVDLDEDGDCSSCLKERFYNYIEIVSTIEKKIEGNDTLLNLEACSFQTVPDGVRYLKTLQQITLDWNDGISLPHWFSELKNLKKLFLRNCNLKEIPSVIERLSNLKSLYLNGNKDICREQIMALSQKLPKLQIFYDK